MSPGGAILHFKEQIDNETLRAVQATFEGQRAAPVFKLVCPDGTGGSREVCIKNPFDVHTHLGAVGHTTIGAVNEVVDVKGRFEKDSVAQGSYNYAETSEKGYPLHKALDVDTDPGEPGFFVVPPDLFKYSELIMRRFPETAPGEREPLAAQKGRAPSGLQEIRW